MNQSISLGEFILLSMAFIVGYAFVKTIFQILKSK